MKKNIVKSLFLVTVCALCLVTLASCKGNDGKSAYDLAVENGFEGTVQEWLDSLVGAPGKDGKDGVDGVDGAAGQDGKDGIDGENGKDGTDGADGEDGKDGVDGEDGSNGKNGKDGEDGLDGVDGIGVKDIAITYEFSDLGVQYLVFTITYSDDSEQVIKTPVRTGEDWEGLDGVTEFEIFDVDALLAFATLVNSGNTFEGTTVKLTADIDLTDVAWTPIGYSKDVNFKGTFDGQGFTISNLTYVNEEKANTPVGFFGFINGTVKNINFENVTIDALSDSGIAVVAGKIFNTGLIENVNVNNATINGNRYVGGIAGHAYGTITKCSVKNSTIAAAPDNLSGSYDNGDKVGGIVGYLPNDGNTNTLTECTVDTVNISAYRDYGSVAGAAGGSRVTNNTVANVTHERNMEQDYDSTKYENWGDPVGRDLEWITSLAALQKAVNEATGDTVIIIGGDISGNLVIPQSEGVSITIKGNNKNFKGTITVNGKSAAYETAALLIENLNFNADAIDYDACINLGVSGDTSTRYTSNVTISGCTFDVPGGVGVKSYTGGDKNLTIVDCTATDKGHSLLQAAGIDGILVDSCVINSKNGINLNNSDNVVITGCEADVKGYAVRFGAGSGGTGYAETYAIKDSTLKSACEDGDAVIILRGTADKATLTIDNTTLDGTTQITNNATDAVVIIDGVLPEEPGAPEDPEEPAELTYEEAHALVVAEFIADFEAATDLTAGTVTPETFWGESDGTECSRILSFVNDDTYNAKWAWLFTFLKSNATTEGFKTAFDNALNKAASGTTDGRAIRTEISGFLQEMAYSYAGWIGTSADYSDATIQAAFLAAYEATLA